MQCIQETYPQFGEWTGSLSGCFDWTCKASSAAGIPCCMGRMSREEVTSMLNGSHLFFVGDSTSRRAALQLRAFLHNVYFTDAKTHGRQNFHYSNAEDNVLVNVTSMWAPNVADLAAVLPTMFNGVKSSTRKVIIFALSTHDFVSMWKEPADSFRRQKWFLNSEATLNSWVQRLTALIGAAASMVKPTKQDMVIVRLPISQGCVGAWTNLCTRVNASEPDSVNYDPRNDFVDRASAIMSAVLREKHGDAFAQLPLNIWTRSDTGVSRQPCTAADYGGTHFRDDFSRMAYVHQVMHAVANMAIDREPWRRTQWFRQRYGFIGDDVTAGPKAAQCAAA
jgi:hypothetical protein